MLGEIFQRFVEKSPIVVMVRGVLERVLGAEALDAWYEQTVQKQYTRTLLFSTLYEWMSAVVFAIKPSVHAAYQGREAKVGASVVWVYHKLKGIELQTSDGGRCWTAQCCITGRRRQCLRGSIARSNAAIPMAADGIPA